MKDSIEPDGYQLSASDKLHAAHLLLSEYLVSPAQDLSKWKKLPKRQIIDLIEAILRRVTWLHEHDAELRVGHVSRLNLMKLLRVLYTTKKLPFTETDLRMMLDLTVPLFDHIAPDGPVDYVMEYIKDNDLTPELCHSLHEFQANLREQGSVMSMQSLRQRLHTLLWMDEWEPLKPSKCWSESIRRDFRAMKGERKARWRRLLKHIRGNAPQRMPPAWAREAADRLAAVGIEDFNQQLSIWFKPFLSEEPLPLSIPGSHILKGLIWYAAVSGDENAKETSMWLLDVKWKQKRNTEKAMTALAVFDISKEELLFRNLIAKPNNRPSRALERTMETLLQAFEAPTTATHVPLDQEDDPLRMLQTAIERFSAVFKGGTTDTPLAIDLEKFSEVFKMGTAATDIVMDPDGDLVVVQGQLHFYRLFRSTGRIERVTDNAELELNWEAIPDQERLRLRRECDSDDQLMLRATMLMYDSMHPHYFRVKRQESQK